MFGEVIFEHSVATAFLAAGLLAALAVAVLSGLWGLPRSRLGFVLILSRVVFILLIAWCLLLPLRRQILTENLKPHFLIALDTSASMAQSPAPRSDSRWATACRLLRQRWLGKLEQTCQVEIFPFDSDVGAPVTAGRFPGLSPSGPSTLLRASLRKIADRYRGQPVAGLLLLSDGLDTREVEDAWAQESFPCPVYTVRLEPPGAWGVEPDVVVETVNTTRRVVVGWDTRLTATIGGHADRGTQVPVELLENGRFADRAVIRLGPEGRPREVVFRLSHPETGTTFYTVRVPPLRGETRTNDNVASVSVQIVDARNRLLYVEDLPRWESKYLNRELQANRAVTPLAFVRGPDRTFLPYGERGTMTLDMTAEQLSTFKIVILGDVSADSLGEARSAALVKFVEAGGSLVLLGGAAAWGPKGFDAGPLRKLLPVQRSWALPAAAGTFAVALTDEGHAHPAFASEAGDWRDLPPVLSVFGGSKPAAGASVLLAAATPEGAQPLVVSQNYGDGKVVSILTDSFWRWQLAPGADRPYSRFWSRMIEWLSPPPAALDAFDVDLFADANQAMAGETVTLKARISPGKKAGASPDMTVVCEIETPEGRRMPFRMNRQPADRRKPGLPVYSVDFTPQTPGIYRATVQAQNGGVRVDSAPFSLPVKTFTPETAALPINETVLRALAASGGRFCEPDELGGVLGRLKVETKEEQRVTFTTQWHTAPVLVCLLGLLALEWIARKVKNLE